MQGGVPQEVLKARTLREQGHEGNAWIFLKQPLGTSRQSGFLQEGVSSGDALCSSYNPAWLNLLTGLAAMAGHKTDSLQLGSAGGVGERGPEPRDTAAPTPVGLTHGLGDCERSPRTEHPVHCPLRAPPVAPSPEPRCRGGHFPEALSPQGGVPAPAWNGCVDCTGHLCPLESQGFVIL